MDDGVKIFAHVEGEGDQAIVLVHGWGFDHTMWKFQIDHLTQQNKYKVVAIDLRGFGCSERSQERYTYERWASDLCTVIKTLDLHDVTLVGYSIGGAIAMKYVTTYPNSPVKKLALIAAAGPCMLYDPENNRDGHTYEFYEKAILALNALTRGLDDPRRAAFEQFYGTEDAIVSDAGLDETGDAMARLEGHLECYGKLLNMFRKAPRKSLVEALEQIRDRDLTQTISQIKMTNTTICHGKLDEFVRPGLAEIQKRLIKDASLALFERSGHGLFFQQDELLNQELDLLLES
jgi:non-heme chloroperoxidase